MFRPVPFGRCSDLCPGGEGVDVQTSARGEGVDVQTYAQRGGGGRCSDLCPKGG